MKNHLLIQFDPKTQEQIEENYTSSNRLIARIGDIQKEYKHENHFPGVIIKNEGNDEMCIGLMLEEWSLIVSIGQEVETQFCSVGNKNRSGSVQFFWQESTASPMSELIAKEKAIKAIEYWLKTGKLSQEIEWTNESY